MENPVEKVKFYPIAKNPRYIPSTSDIENMEQALNHKQLKLFRFVLETGCRITEALDLAVDDVEDSYVILRTRQRRNSVGLPRRVPRPLCLEDKDLPKSGRVFSTWTSYPMFLANVQEKWANSGDGAASRRNPKKL